MEPEMSSLFPNGIRALIVDDDAKFLKPATMLLSALNFKVSTCSSATSALRLLSSDKNKDTDVVLAHAEKAATCGFDFRAIIESDLRIPVVYFLSPDHKATGDAADELLRTLHAATYVIKKPFDINDVFFRNLWRVIAWRKCCLEAKASGGGAGGNGVVSAVAGGAALAGSATATSDDEEHVHFKVVRAAVRDRKRRSSSSNNNPGVSSSGAGGVSAKRRQEDLNVATTGQEKDNMNSQQQEQKNPGKRAKNNGGEASMLQQQPRAMNYGQNLGQRQPHESLFLQSVLRTLNLPAYNPKIFTDAAGPSNSVAAAFAGASSTATPAPALPPVSYSTLATTPIRPPVNPELPPIPSVRQQLLPTSSKVFGSITPPVTEVKPMAATTATCEPQFFNGNKQQKDVCLSQMFGPFPYNGPLPTKMQQDMFAPPAGDLFTGMAGGITAIGAVAAAAAPTQAGAYGNKADSFLQPPNLGAEQDGDDDELAAMVAMYPMDNPPVAVPQGLGGFASNEKAMVTPHDNNFSHYGAGSFFALDQAIGMPANVNGLTMAGGAFGFDNAASLVAPQDLGVVPNGGHQAPGAVDNMIYGTFMGSEGTGAAAMDMNAADGLSAAMFPSDQYEESNLFPLEALLDLHTTMYDADLDAQYGGSTSGGGAGAGGVAGTSLSAGEGGMNSWDIGAADGLEMPDDLFMDSSTGNFLQYIMNNGHE